MSYSYRERPSLRERLRGKSGEELIKELRQEMNQDRKMFFDSPTSRAHQQGSFFNRHFPFDDSEDDGLMRGGRSNLQAHLDDLAQRHPELAEQLRPWRAGGPPDTVSEPPSSEQQSGGQAAAQTPLATKLSSTVPDMQQAEEELEARGVRSRSAPPASAQADQPQNQQHQQQQQPFVSRVDVNHQQVPQQQPPQPQSEGRQPTVRHIPIFVEGRDEPLLPKEAVDSSSSFPQQYRTQFHQHSGYQQPPERPSSAGGQYQRQEQQSNRMPQQQQPNRVPPQQQQQPNRVPPQQPQPNRVPPSHQQQQQASSRTSSSSQSEPQEAEEGQQRPPSPPPPPQVLVLDPIARVGIIQKEVEALKEKVDEFQDGHSRQDKDYIYLDEMLTRNLLKLDDIETEGREDVRSARKEAIRSIQRCISILDSKTAPQPQPQQQQPSDEAAESTSADAQSSSSEQPAAS